MTDTLASPTPPTITVIIVAYNSGDFLQPCVDALATQSFTDFEAVIVDNASTDGAVDSLTLPDDRFRIDRPGENLGFAGGNNRAARASHARWIALLNPDTRVAPNWLEALLDGLSGFRIHSAQAGRSGHPRWRRRCLVRGRRGLAGAGRATAER